MIAIIDYGMGNLCSVQKALERIGAATQIIESPDILPDADKIILPGVGSFGDAMQELERRGFVIPLKQEVSSGKPLLGICLGLQVLFETSEESPGARGLGLIPGECRRFVTDLKVPHMGWNQVRIKRRAPIFEGIEDGAYFYFVHSFYVIPREGKDVASTTDYALDFCSSVWRDNLFATQFHPEKSQETGLRFLENFVKL